MKASRQELVEACRLKRWQALRRAGQVAKDLHRAEERARLSRELAMELQKAESGAEEMLSRRGPAWRHGLTLARRDRLAAEQAGAGEQVSQAAGHLAGCRRQSKRCLEEMGRCQSRLDAAVAILAEEVRAAARLEEAAREQEHAERLSGNRSPGMDFSDTAGTPDGDRRGNFPDHKVFC